MKKSEFFISLLLITGLIIFCYLIFKNKVPDYLNKTNDTVYVNKYIFDTLTKFKDKVIYKSIEPKKITILKTDSIVLPQEIIIQAEAEDSKLKIISFNLNDSLFKEYDIPEINQDFRIKSFENGLKIETKKFHFTGINLYTGIEYNLKNTQEKVDYVFGIETGFKIKNNYEINFGVQYKKNQENVSGVMKLKYKL